jgi:hypothetical protein
LGRAVACIVVVRSSIAKGNAAHAEKLFGWDGVWIDNDNILFLSRAAGEKDDSIYRMSADGKNLRRLIKNARSPSVNPP